MLETSPGLHTARFTSTGAADVYATVTNGRHLSFVVYSYCTPTESMGVNVGIVDPTVFDERSGTPVLLTLDAMVRITAWLRGTEMQHIEARYSMHRYDRGALFLFRKEREVKILSAGSRNEVASYELSIPRGDVEGVATMLEAAVDAIREMTYSTGMIEVADFPKPKLQVGDRITHARIGGAYRITSVMDEVIKVCNLGTNSRALFYRVWAMPLCSLDRKSERT